MVDRQDLIDEILFDYIYHLSKKELIFVLKQLKTLK
jgi:hypothetical protein